MGDEILKKVQVREDGIIMQIAVGKKKMKARGTRRHINQSRTYTHKASHAQHEPT